MYDQQRLFKTTQTAQGRFYHMQFVMFCFIYVQTDRQNPDENQYMLEYKV